MGNVMNILGRCQDAADGKLSPEEQERLASQIRGVFSIVPVPRQPVDTAIAKRDWGMLEGILSGYIDTLESQGRGVNVNATATASASSSAVSFSSVCADLERTGMDGDAMREVRALMNELDGAKDEGMAKHAAKKIMDTVIEKCADALPVVAPFVAQALGSFAGA